MASFLTVIILFWLTRTVKQVLFWVYLWQLKEYHIGRFRDHFRTYHGKQLLWGRWQLAKYVTLVAFMVLPYFFWVATVSLLALYALEVLIFIRQIIQKQVKKPTFTFKTLLLTTVSLGLAALFALVLANTADIGLIVRLLVFDILLPLIVSVIVLLFQPLFVAVRIRTLKKAAQKRDEFPNLKVIGITGSYGKTSTKEFLKTILSKKFSVLATHKHKNSEMGIAQTILQQLNAKHQIFIAEMGAYKKGGIKLLCDMVRPEIGLLTGVNEQHLALFGSLDNLLSAEGGGELLVSLPSHGLLVVNGDNKYCFDLYKKANIRKLMYTVAGDKLRSDIWAQEVVMTKDHVSFVVMTHDRHIAQFKVNILGHQQVQNLLAAILVANDLGMSLEEIAIASREINQEQGGMTLHEGAHGIEVIDSSYSANPTGVMADLDYLSIFSGKKVIIMPCLIELGSESASAHYEIGKKIANVCDMAIITTKDQFEMVKQGALEEGMATNNILFCDDSNEILHHIAITCKKGDAVLLEGRVPTRLIKLLNGKQI